MSRLRPERRPPQRAHRENVETVENAVGAARAVGARWCYLSSAYVFDGRADAPYREDTPLSPVSEYGRTKARGEAIGREALGDRALIARTMLVWGPDPQEKNFAYQVVRHARAQKPLRVPCDQRGNPTYGPDLAAALIALMERGAGGVWHVAGPEAELDRFAFARLLCDQLGLAPAFLNPVTTAQSDRPVRRPLNGSLATDKLAAAGLTLQTVAEAVRAWRGEAWPWPDA